MRQRIFSDRSAGVAGGSVWQRLFLLTAFLLTIGAFGWAQAHPSFESVRAGAYDPDAWNGLVFLTRALEQPAVFAVRVGSLRGRGLLDGNAIFDNVVEVGPHAPDGSYCRMAWRQRKNQARVTLEWSRIDRTTIVGRLSAGHDFSLVLETYFPAGMHGGSGGVYRIDQKDRAIVGRHFFNQVYGHAAQFVVMVNQPLAGSGAYQRISQLEAQMNGSGRLVPAKAEGFNPTVAGLQFATGASGTAEFVAEVGWSRSGLLSRARGLLQPGRIDSILRAKAQAYANSRPTVTGLFEDASHAIGNSMFWNSLYVASNNLVFPSISRHWAHGWGGWVVGEWDCFFGTLLTSLESKGQTEAGAKAILLAQTSTGVVPNIAAGNGITPDRSQPPVGAFCVWKTYQRFHDRRLLAWAYPRLKKWHSWWFGDRGDGQPWRDGNRDGLLEWGSDRGSESSIGGRGFLQAAKWESGMDDSPMWDHATYNPRTYTMNLDDVGLNSLYALDAECLSRIAAILGKQDDARQYAAEYARIKKRVQSKLWNPAAGIYENRYWDGRFSKRLSPTNFYPLFAGIATPQQAERMVTDHLLNPREFWGKYVIPTIARDDPAFADQFYWRGDIWGPTDYMVYEGLNRYRFDKVALEFAGKNYNLYMDDWRKNQHDNEQYFAWGGSAGGDKHYTWGALLCLAGLEQYLDANPWDNLRFGALNPPARGEFRGVKLAGHTYAVTIGPGITEMVRDGRTRFEASSGVVVREYHPKPSELSFTIHAGRPTRVSTGEFASGTLLLKIDGKPSGRIAVENGKATFEVPAGEHRVELRKTA